MRPDKDRMESPSDMRPWPQGCIAIVGYHGIGTIFPLCRLIFFHLASGFIS